MSEKLEEARGAAVVRLSYDLPELEVVSRGSVVESST